MDRSADKPERLGKQGRLPSQGCQTSPCSRVLVPTPRPVGSRSIFCRGGRRAPSRFPRQASRLPGREHGRQAVIVSVG